MYLCNINYTGNDTIGDASVYESITINGNTTTDPRALKDLAAIWNRVNGAFSSEGLAPPLVTVMSNNSGDAISIKDNTGDNLVFVTVFYPNADFTGSIDVTVNGALETFTFEKVGTV